MSVLLCAFRRILSPPVAATSVDAIEKLEFCKVEIDEFVARPKNEFDVYIKLSESKAAELANKGEKLPKDRISYYKEKGIKHLHILREDFYKLVDFNINVTKMIKDRTDISQQKKLNFTKYTGEVLMEKVFVKRSQFIYDFIYKSLKLNNFWSNK